MPRLGNTRAVDTNRRAQDDPRINPDGIYSGMTKRLANTDGKFADVSRASKGKSKQ